MTNFPNYFENKKDNSDQVKFITIEEIINMFARNKKFLIKIFLITFIFSSSTSLINKIFRPQYKGFFTILVEEPVEYESEYFSTTNYEQVSLIQNLAKNKYSTNLPTLKVFLKNDDILTEIFDQFNIGKNTLRQTLKISTPKEVLSFEEPPGIYKVELTTNKKDLTLSVLKKLSQIYLDSSLDLRKKRIQEGLNFLNNQEPILIKKANEAQDKLVSFRIKNAIIDPIEEVNIMKLKEKELDAKIVALEIQRKRLINAKAEIKAGNISARSYEFAINPNISGISEKTSKMDGGLVIGGKNQSLMREVTELENELSKARLKYLEESKVVKVYKDRLASIRSKFKETQLETIAAALSLNNSKLEDIKFQMKILQSKSKDNPILIKEYNSLNQNLNIANNNLKSLITVQENLQLELAQTSIPWKIIEYPKISNQRLRRILVEDFLLFFFISFATTLIATYIKDMSKFVFYSSKEIENKLDYPLLENFPKIDFSFLNKAKINNLSIIDKLKALDKYNGNNESLLNQKYLYKEVCKNIFTSLNLIRQDLTIKKILITSSENDEGKTFISITLAKVISEIGKKVLLIDTNFRDTSFATQLKLEKILGISDFIFDQDKNLNDIIHKLPNLENLDLITIGTKTNIDPALILVSERFKLFINQIEKNNFYDLVLFVNAPTSYDSDNKLIAEFIDANIYLITLNKVNNKLPNKAIEKVFFNMPNIGIVINNYYSNNFKSI